MTATAKPPYDKDLYTGADVWYDGSAQGRSFLRHGAYVPFEELAPSGDEE